MLPINIDPDTNLLGAVQLAIELSRNQQGRAATVLCADLDLLARAATILADHATEQDASAFRGGTRGHRWCVVCQVHVAEFAATTDRELQLLIDHGTTPEVRAAAAAELARRQAEDAG